MPELPEVETTIKSLNILKNKKVTNLDIHSKKLRYPVPHIELKKIARLNMCHIKLYKFQIFPEQKVEKLLSYL